VHPAAKGETMRRAIPFLAVSWAFCGAPGICVTHTEVVECPSGAHLLLQIARRGRSIQRGSDLTHVVVRYAPEPAQA